MPLKKATSSGIAVMGTRLASTAPPTPPARQPRTTIQSATVPYRSTSVAPIASSMATEASQLPARAVRTPERRFRPNTKSSALAM
jgi:hypothetical protein